MKNNTRALSILLFTLFSTSVSWASQVDSAFWNCVSNDKQANKIMLHAAEWPESMSHFPNRYVHLSSRQAGGLVESLKSDLEDFDSLYKAVDSISRNYCSYQHKKIMNRLIKKQLVSLSLVNHMSLLKGVFEGMEQQTSNMKRLEEHQKKAELYFHKLKGYMPDE